MTLFDNIAKRFGYQKQPTARRNYAAAAASRLLNGWTTQNLTADALLRYSLRQLRARSRELARNDNYARKFLAMVKNNVVGPNGIVLQSKAKDPKGNLDKNGNSIIEASWDRWGTKKNASVCTTLSWLDIQRMFIETVARDGEAIIRKVKGYDNPFRFALQFIEADHLDENLNVAELPNGNQIRMGVEVDPWGRPVAYHLLTKHPGDFTYASGGLRYQRVPADEIIHAFIKERPTQTRGVPWMASAMISLNMVHGYAEAELTAARLEACKMGFFTSPDGDGYTGDGKDEKGNIITEAEPGAFEQLPSGVTFQEYDPKHPNGNFANFLKAGLRGIASGLCVSYNGLASDLEGVNYSSIRQGVLDERDQWKVLHGWMIENLNDEVYPEWLEMGLLTQAIPLPAAKFDKWNAPKWQARGFAWVDPYKDQMANSEGVNMGFKTRAMVLADQGLDVEDVFEQLAIEKALAEQYGLTFADAIPKPQTVPDNSGGTDATNQNN